MMTDAEMHRARQDRDIIAKIRNTMIRVGLTPIDVPNYDVLYPYSSLIAKLNDFTFKMGHSYYWRVNGPMPLANAKTLYDNPVGKTDIRVTGHCGCPPPEGNNVDWFDRDSKKKIMSVESWNQCKELLKPDYWAEKVEKNHIPKDNHDNADGFIGSYHVDSELGLYMVVQEIKYHVPVTCIYSDHYKDNKLT